MSLTRPQLVRFRRVAAVDGGCYITRMTKAQIDLVLEGVRRWPAEDQEELAELAREIEARRTGVYLMDDATAPEQLFTSDPAVMGGRTVFRGTRIPVEVLFENLADGMSLEEILDAYPTLKREDAVAAIELAEQALKVGHR